MWVQDIMTTGMITVKRDDNLQRVDEIMAAGHIRHIPVVEDDHVVGVASQRELFNARVASTMEMGETDQHSFLHTLPIDGVMTTPVITIPPDTSVSKAAALMMNRGIGCLIVVNHGALEGIVTKTDVLRCLRDMHEVAQSTPAE